MRWVVVTITGVWALGRGVNGLTVTSPSSFFARHYLSSLRREAGGRETREIMGKWCGKQLNAAGPTSVGEELRQEMEDIVEKAQKRRMQSIQELKEEILNRDSEVVRGGSGFGERAPVEKKQKADEEKVRSDGASSLSMPKQGSYYKKVDLGRLSMPSRIEELQHLVISLREFIRTYMSRARKERDRLNTDTKRLNVLLSKGEAKLASTQASYSAYMTKSFEVRNKAALASVKPVTAGASVSTKQYKPSLSTAVTSIVASHPKYATRTYRVGWQSRWGPEEDQRVAVTRESSENQRTTAAGNPSVPSNSLAAYEANPMYAIRTKRTGWENRWGLEEEVRVNANGQLPTPSSLSGFSTEKLHDIDLLRIVAELS